jgi:hypothetical protein
VVAAFLGTQATGDGGNLQQVAFLFDLHPLGGDLLYAVPEGLPGCPPLAGQLDAVGGFACQLPN